MFVRFSGHDNSIHNIIPLLKKENEQNIPSTNLTSDCSDIQYNRLNRCPNTGCMHLSNFGIPNIITTANNFNRHSFRSYRKPWELPTSKLQQNILALVDDSISTPHTGLIFTATHSDFTQKHFPFFASRSIQELNFSIYLALMLFGLFLLTLVHYSSRRYFRFKYQTPCSSF